MAETEIRGPTGVGEQNEDCALQLTGITKRFGPTVALNDASLTVRAATSHALVGENGAGKSTLVKIVNGVIHPDAGAIEVFGRVVALRGPQDAANLGIGTAYQEMSLVPDLTVAENIFLGGAPRVASRLALKRRLRAGAEALFERLGVARIDPDWLARDLTLPEKQVVEITKSLRADPRLIFLDESTSALTKGAMDWFYDLIERLRAEGKTLVFITHRLAEIRQACQRVTVLRNGHVAGDFAIDEVSESEVIRLMIGRSLQSAYPPRRPKVDRPVVLETRGLSKRPAFEHVDLQLRRGEILGISGLDGQGQREFFLTLFGVLRPDGGEVWVEQKRVKIRSPIDAIAAGLGISLVPEERKTEGLFLKLPVAINMALPVLNRMSTLGWIHAGAVRRAVGNAASRVNVDHKVVGAEAGSLSGGNQQKVVIGKWVLAGAKYLLLYDPTRGVDVGTKFEIYRLMQELANEGVSILFYSSELPEVINIADRSLVFYRSHIVAEFDGDEQTEENVMAAAVGYGEASRT